MNGDVELEAKIIPKVLLDTVFSRLVFYHGNSNPN